MNAFIVLKIVFAIYMVFDFFWSIEDREDKTDAEFAFSIGKFFLFAFLVATRNFF